MSVKVQFLVDTEKGLKGTLSLTLIGFDLFFRSVNITKHLIKTTKTADMIMWPVFKDADTVHSISIWQNENEACNDRLFTSFKIVERKKAANLSLFSTSSKWIYNKRSECRQLITKFRKCFFSVRVKFKSSREQVSVLFWAFIWFLSCHRQPDDCLFIWILKKANPDIISNKQKKAISECFAFHYS